MEHLNPVFVNTFSRYIKIISRSIGLYILPENDMTFAQKYIRISIFVAFYTPMIVGQVMYVTMSNRTGATFLEVANAIPTTFMALQDGVKMLVFLTKRNQIRNAITEISEMWPSQSQREDKEITLNNRLLRLKSIDNTFLITTSVVLIICETFPLFLSIYDIYKNPDSYQYLFPLQVYYVCWLTSHVQYAIWYFSLIVTTSLTHLALYVAGDFLLVSWTYSLSTLFILLQMDLEHVVANYNENSEDNYEEIKKIIVAHQKLMRLADELRAIFALLVFIHVSFSSVIICCFGFLTVIADGMLIRNLASSCIIMFAIWNQCWPGQLLADSSFGVGEAAYRSQWYERDVKFQKYILIIMIRAQKPCYLTALGFSDLTLANFSKVLSTSWSYLSLLNQMYQNMEF